MIYYPTTDCIWDVFIIAPLPIRQDSLIFGSEFMLGKESELINIVYASDLEANNREPTISMFSFYEYKCLSVTMKSVYAVEKESGRNGLSLTIGLLIKEKIISRLDTILPIINYVLERFGRLFEIDLNKREEYFFLNKLQNLDKHEEITSRLNRLHYIISCKNVSKKYDIIRKHDFKNLSYKPTIVLVPVNLRVSQFIELFLCLHENNKNLFDRNISNRTKKDFKKIYMQQSLANIDSMTDISEYTNQNKLPIIYIYSSKEYMMLEKKQNIMNRIFQFIYGKLIISQ